jgi:hypothetical protein
MIFFVGTVHHALGHKNVNMDTCRSEGQLYIEQSPMLVMMVVMVRRSCWIVFKMILVHTVGIHTD